MKHPSPVTRRPALALVVGALGLLGGCAKNAPQDTLEPDGPIARQLDNLWDPVLAIAGFFFVLVNALIIIVAVKFRQKSDDDAPVQVHGNTRLEFGWTVIPFVILVGVGFFTILNVVDISRIPKGADVVRVNVIGHQWWWEYEYPDLGVTTANEMHIPAGRKVDVRLTSVDVIHSFWPPKLAGKLDAIPGRENHMVVEADLDDIGKTFDGQCVEFCGDSHANMRLKVVVHSSDDFAAWAKQNASKPDIADGTSDAGQGAALFKTKGCGGCHTVSGYTAGDVGPDLSHLYQRKTFAGAIFPLDDENLRRWLRNPPKEKPMMPDDGIGMPNLGLTEDEISKLIAFLKTLK